VRSLVVCPNWVGDLVMAAPTIDALAGAGRQVVALAKPGLRPLAALLPGVAASLDRLPDDRATIEMIRAAGCEEAVILPNSFRSAWLPRQAGIPRRAGYRGGWRAPLLVPALPAPRGRRKRPQIADYAELLAALGVPAPASWVPRLELPPSLRERGRERLERGHLRPGSAPLVGLFPGAEFGPSKRWPWRRFAELALALRRARPGLQQLIVAGPKELWTAVRVHEESGKLHPVIGPDLDLAGLAAVLAHLDLLVTNDSGPMHLAAALGVPCVALFGPTDPRRTAPAGDGHRVLHLDRWCSPCFRRRCPLLHHRCLRDIAVPQVAAAALAGLAEGHPGSIPEAPAQGA